MSVVYKMVMHDEKSVPGVFEGCIRDNNIK